MPTSLTNASDVTVVPVFAFVRNLLQDPHLLRLIQDANQSQMAFQEVGHVHAVKPIMPCRCRPCTFSEPMARSSSCMLTRTTRCEWTPPKFWNRPRPRWPSRRGEGYEAFGAIRFEPILFAASGHAASCTPFSRKSKIFPHAGQGARIGSLAMLAAPKVNSCLHLGQWPLMWSGSSATP